MAPRLTREEYLDGWARLHGTDPRASPLVHGWLSLCYLAARPLAAVRAAPDVLTVLGLLVAAAGV